MSGSDCQSSQCQHLTFIIHPHILKTFIKQKLVFAVLHRMSFIFTHLPSSHILFSMLTVKNTKYPKEKRAVFTHSCLFQDVLPILTLVYILAHLYLIHIHWSNFINFLNNHIFINSSLTLHIFFFKVVFKYLGKK